MKNEPIRFLAQFSALAIPDRFFRFLSADFQLDYNIGNRGCREFARREGFLVKAPLVFEKESRLKFINTLSPLFTDEQFTNKVERS